MTVHRADVVLDAELFRLAQEAFAAGDLEGVAALLQEKGRERAADRAAAVRALRTDAPEGAVRQGGLPQADLEHTSEVRAPRSPTSGQDHGAPTSPAQGDDAPPSVATGRPGVHTRSMPLDDTPIDVLLDSLEQAYEQSPEEGWWPWVWALVNRLYAALDGVEPDAVRNAAMDAATDAVILVKAIDNGSDEAISYARKMEARLKPWYQWDADA